VFDPVDRGFSRLVFGACGTGKNCRRPGRSGGKQATLQHHSLPFFGDH
jgi:hypothetical protein